jgi:phosphotransferase system enzyme I (PtsI)
MATKIITGIIASPGIRIGKAFIYKGAKIVIPQYKINDNEIEKEIQRFNIAKEQTKQEIKAIQEQIASSLSTDLANIFTSHIMVLEDPSIEEKAINAIRNEKRNVEWVLNDISMELIKSLNSIHDDYLRERIIDISDIHKRLIANLQKVEHLSLADLEEEVIVFANDLTPSDTALMDRNNVLAFVTDKGGRTSHTAILARALEIPAIVGTIDATANIKNGDIIIIDGVHGKIIINPSGNEIESYIKEQEELLLLERELSKLTHLPSQTMDDVKVKIYGNIELPEEMQLIKDHGADGIGLFRSEFLFMDKSLPDEEKQFQEYKNVVEYFNPLPVTIRTIDVGGDKVYAFTEDYKERNPFLGCRAIRFSLQNKNLFKAQIRAILRASHYGNVKMMFPMISIIDEIITAKEIVNEAKTELRAENTPFDENLDIGIMIEVPSALINADILSEHSDFFSVGTNDLIQYTLAVDRIGEKVAYLYNPIDLSILRMLKNINIVGLTQETALSICGEMAGEPKYTMVLIGLGFRALSMSATYMYQVKRIVRSVTVKECEELVQKILKFSKVADANAFLKEYNEERFPFLVN